MTMLSCLMYSSTTHVYTDYVDCARQYVQLDRFTSFVLEMKSPFPVTINVWSLSHTSDHHCDDLLGNVVFGRGVAKGASLSQLDQYLLTQSSPKTFITITFPELHRRWWKWWPSTQVAGRNHNN